MPGHPAATTRARDSPGRNDIFGQKQMAFNNGGNWYGGQRPALATGASGSS